MKVLLKILFLFALLQCGHFTLIQARNPLRRGRVASDDDHEQLEKTRRNAICCAKKLRCCNPNPPDIEVRAVLTRCPNIGRDSSIITRSLKRPIYPLRDGNIKNFQGFDEDEITMQTDVTDCARKLLLTINIKNVDMTNCKNQYILVDHVYDPVSDKSVRILNPYVIKLKQEPVAQTYPMQFLDYVNSEAREQVFNKHDGNYTGCCTNVWNSTCGVVRYHGKVIPYSQGFCCSCDATVNARRQPESESISPTIALSDPAYLLDDVQCPRNFFRDSKKYTYFERKRAMDSRKRRDHPKNYYNVAHDRETSPRFGYKDLMRDRAKRYSSRYQSPISISFHVNRNMVEEPSKEAETYLSRINAHNQKQDQHYLDIIKKTHNIGKHSANYLEGISAKRRKHRTKRQVMSSGVQRRGGQNCADRYTPPGLDHDCYHESAHCLRFSDLWYAVYKLGKPQVAQTIQLQIFEKLETECGDQGSWRDLTQGEMVRLGPFDQTYIDANPATISMRYSSKFQRAEAESLFKLDPESRLLVPEQSKRCTKFPEAMGGSREYLVVRPEQIEFEGTQCDKVGVGFEGFFKQNKRCAMPRGTCLKNQPKHLWRHDKRLEKRGIKGCYFLQHYAVVPDEAIRKNNSCGKQYLALEYSGEHLSIVDMEIRADYNAIIRPQATAVITEVYIDSTKPSSIVLTVKVTNSGLLSNKFLIRISDVPLEMTGVMDNIESHTVLISPQNQHIFKLQTVNLSLPVDIFYCTIEVLNPKRQLLALRRIRIQKSDRCICTWHCLCACVGSSEGLKCKPMSIQHYHAAGFQGSLPMITYMDHYTLMEDVLSLFLYLLLFIVFTLLILGLTKAILGLCFQTLGYWGLNVLLDLPRPIRQYYEHCLRGQPVVYDEYGWPINPQTLERVRVIGYPLMIIVNLFFFFTYPVAVIGIVINRICCHDGSTLSERYSQTTTCTDFDCVNKKGGKRKPKDPGAIVMSMYDYPQSNTVRRRQPICPDNVILEEPDDEDAENEEVEEEEEVETTLKTSAYKREFRSSNRTTSRGPTTEEEEEEEEEDEEEIEQIQLPSKGTQYNIDNRTVTTDTSLATSPTNVSRECLCDNASSI